ETRVEGVEADVSPALHPQPAGAATKAAARKVSPLGVILIMAPILAPAAKKLGIDLVHFGIVMDVNMEVGLCHPPVGLN
ncbi:TRAP transporter large permease subunit, partial [Pseudomonas sp. GW456-11-11-14-TSB2]|uniref:TRAP transporter large permease subunit n=1 Tax=Pseudomonas sp. GW456-11-11-14-TSB2 TaxID=2751348 RepID=UPI001C4743DF